MGPRGFTSDLGDMDETQQVAWMVRRLTLGGGVADLAKYEAKGPTATYLELTTPAPGVVTSPFGGLELPEEFAPEDVVAVLTVWLTHMRTTPDPFGEWMAWFWHDHFAISAGVVRDLTAFVGHIDLLCQLGLATFDDLLRAVTTDPAMLVFLDGRRNQRGAINENYGRELLELYALGIGNYTEDDVLAASVALSGWVWRPGLDNALFVPSRHDNTPQTLFGVTVGDVDGVVAAVTAQPACAQHVVRTLGQAVLGSAPTQANEERLADDFVTSGLDVRSLASSLIELALNGGSEPIVLSPVVWLNQAEALTGAIIEPEMRVAVLRQMGQMPGVPPNVGGYPGAETWAGPSSTIGRFRAASLVAGRTPDGAPVLDAARQGEWDELAHLAARPDGFSFETKRSLDGTNRTRRGGREALAAALMSPELVVA